MYRSRQKNAINHEIVRRLLSAKNSQSPHKTITRHTSFLYSERTHWVVEIYVRHWNLLHILVAVGKLQSSVAVVVNCRHEGIQQGFSEIWKVFQLRDPFSSRNLVGIFSLRRWKSVPHLKHGKDSHFSLLDTGLSLSRRKLTIHRLHSLITTF